MYEFGDELELIINNSHRIPWLIWIQLLAMLLLLILLLSFFTTAPSDLSTTASAASPFVDHSLITSNTRHNSKVRENEIKETGTSTSEVVQRAKKPDGRPRVGSSTTNDGGGKMSERSHHPCHIFGIAKHVFLKCLGIDSGHEKED